MPDKFGWDNNFGNKPAPSRHMRWKAEQATDRCVHCGVDRQGQHCMADPHINKEPREYCSLARRMGALPATESGKS